MFQIVHFQKLLDGQCLNRIRLTAPLYILLAIRYSFSINHNPLIGETGFFVNIVPVAAVCTASSTLGEKVKVSTVYKSSARSRLLLGQGFLIGYEEIIFTD